MKCIDVIYITSTAYSGSTILGFIMGSSPQIFNAGEIQYFNRLQKKDEVCSCWALSHQCPFWSNIYKHHYNIFRKPSFLKNIRISLYILLRKKITQDILIDSDEYKLLDNIFENAKKFKPKTEYIIDNSKSLWRLVFLMKCSGINLKVIYLHRDMFGCIASFVKHNKGFWRGVFRFKIINYLIRRLLINNSLDYITINYNTLCNNSVKELEKIGGFLKVNIKEYSDKLNLKNTHVQTGNIGTRKSLENYRGLQCDYSWKETLSIHQKNILKIIN